MAARENLMLQNLSGDMEQPSQGLNWLKFLQTGGERLNSQLRDDRKLGHILVFHFIQQRPPDLNYSKNEAWKVVY